MVTLLVLGAFAYFNKSSVLYYFYLSWLLLEPKPADSLEHNQK